MSAWHQQSADETLQSLESNLAQGLSAASVSSKRAKHGPNELTERAIKSVWKILWEQMTAIMIIVLMVAAVVSLLLGEWQDAVAILAIVVLNAILGVRQEYRAEKAMAALNRLAMPSARVRRDGHVAQIPTRELVPGDIILLDAGARVPADCRLLEVANLQVEEASLTGESVPVEKRIAPLPNADTPLADRNNMLYLGTAVTYGRGVGVVVETGMRTELGKIAQMIQDVDRAPTPLQIRLDRLGKVLAVVAVILVLTVFGLGLWREGTSHLRELFLTAVSMAVAAVPEGLPAVVTIALALGAQRMLARNTLIRKLLAVEALGSVSVICSDKTGTLTQNRMTVQKVYAEGRMIEEAPGSVELAGAALTYIGMALCNDAEMEDAAASAEAVATGDPTETALAAAAANHGFQKRELEAAMPRIMEAPFDSERKRMTTVHRIERNPLQSLWTPPGQVVAFTKGSMESVLSQCSQLISAGTPAELSDDARNELMTIGEDLAANGMRVLGVALREFDAPPEQSSPEFLETGLAFCGICAMIDPPRPEVRDAVRLCKSAGIRPMMITGDHPLTALHIAAELGIEPRDGRVITGAELATMDAARLRKVVAEVSVFARVAPQSKLDIVAALQANDQVVAMTGDGVNDAPALKKANIGIAMGITGTDVSKEASDMVLLDDNFATIVAAVAEGRTIYDNIRKFIKYLMTTNVGELWVMLAAPILGMPLPLMPLQILWMNLVTDGLPALALGVEPAEADVMRRPPTRPNESIFAHGMGVHIVWVGLLMAVISLGVGYAYWRVEPSGYGEATRWQTMVFTVLTLSQMANVMAIRAGRASLFTAGIFTNRPLVLAVAATFLLQVAILYVPIVQTFFRTVALSATDFLIALALSMIVFVAVEIEKWIARANASRANAPDVAAEA